MALPLYQYTWSKTKIKSSGRTIHFRPFTVAESKNLMVKKEDDNSTEFYEEIANILKACVKEDDFNPLKLYPVDFESLFYDIRSYSDSSLVTFNKNYTDDAGRERLQELMVDLKSDLVLSNKNFEFKLNIPENKMIVTFNIPKMGTIIELENKKYEKEEYKIFDMMGKCLTSVIQEENVYNNFTQDEALEFIDSLPITYLEKIAEFFNDMPVLKCQKEFELEGRKEKYVLSEEDMKHFFQ